MSLEIATINDHSEPVTIMYGTGIERYLESDECANTIPVKVKSIKEEVMEVKCQ
jgi:hypothetical protein